MSYFQAYLAPDPEAAVAEQARRDPAVAERARKFLADRQIRRILALPDPQERVSALLPFFAGPEPGAAYKAQAGIRAAGAVAGPLLVPLFENPTRPRLRADVIRLWGEIGYREAVPRLIRVLLEEEAFWVSYNLKPGWWSHFAENGLPPEASTDHYGSLYASVYALRAFADPAAKEGGRAHFTGLVGDSGHGADRRGVPPLFTGDRLAVRAAPPLAEPLPIFRRLAPIGDALDQKKTFSPISWRPP